MSVLDKSLFSIHRYAIHQEKPTFLPLFNQFLLLMLMYGHVITNANIWLRSDTLATREPSSVLHDALPSAAVAVIYLEVMRSNFLHAPLPNHQNHVSIKCFFPSQYTHSTGIFYLYMNTRISQICKQNLRLFNTKFHFRPNTNPFQCLNKFRNFFSLHIKEPSF